jgi:hypothetical protein
VGIFDDLFKSKPNFNTGPLRAPTKFRVVCNRCSDEATMSIPPGYQEPSVLVECACGNAESLSVERT